MEREITFKDIQEANASIKTTDIKGKDYAEVNQRIKAFRMVFPLGFIQTMIESNEDGVCVMHATVGYYDDCGMVRILGEGTAYEKEASSYINKTSYIENCETSAVGRALGMAGFGIDTSVASAEEVQNAMLNQQQVEVRMATPKQLEVLKRVYIGDNLTKLLQVNGISKIEDLPMETASTLISKLKGRTDDNYQYDIDSFAGGR